MAAPHDANIGGVERAKKVLRAKVVRKKAPPLPVPSMEATLKIPHVTLAPKPAAPVQRSVVFKPGPAPAPHGGHVPIKVLKESALDLSLPAPAGSTRAKQVAAYNQQEEKQRRADARAQRVAVASRRAYVRSLPPEARSFLGSDKLSEFVQTGAIQQHPGVGDYAKAIGGGLLHGIESLPGHAQAALEDFNSRLSGGARGRVHSEIRPEDSPVVSGLTDVMIGSNFRHAMEGKDFNPYGLAAELALVAVPLKGLPTPITAGLRLAVGASRLARMERAGMTTLDIAEVLTKPIAEVKAAHRASLVAKAALPGTEPIPSSKIAGVLAGKGQGKVARFIRNDVRTKRVFTVGNDTVETAADLSRTGKIARKALDRIRDSRVVPLRSNETLGIRALSRQIAQHSDRAAGLEHTLNTLTRGRLRALPDWPAQYAVRMVGKGITPAEAIRTTEQAMQAAEAAGDKLGVEANRVHLAMFKKAEKYVTEDANGVPVFRPDAPPQLEALRETLQRVSGTREDVYRRLDKLSDEVMRGRVLNEQLYYAGAKLVDPGREVSAAFSSSPIRQRIEALVQAQQPEAAPHIMQVLDANARRHYEMAAADLDQRISEAEAAVARNQQAPHLPRLERDLAALKQEKAALNPADWYNQNIKEIADVLPADIAEKISKDYGVQGADWRFSIYDSEDEVKAASKRIADEIVAAGLPLPPEWDTPEKIHEGIHNVFRLARDGESGKDWYPQAAEGVMRVSDATGVDPKTVAQLFAIYSQAADTIANSTFVFKAIREYQKYGDLFVGRFPTRQSEEALSVLRGGTWEGRKRSSFYANILRHIPGMEDEYAATIKEMADARGAPVAHPVTVDRWVVRMFRPETKKDTPEKFYDTFETIIQKMADHVGWEPEQIQAAAWVAVKQMGFESEIAKAGGKVKGTLSARLAAGSEDAFQYGINKNLERMAEAPKPGAIEVTPQMKRLANQANKKWGGFTVGRDLKPVPERGYSVSYSLTERAFKLHGLKPEDIARFRDDYAGLLKDARNKIGGFSDDLNEAGDGTEKTLLSITRHFRSKDEALAFAREQGQETVYEYKTGDGIRTGLSRDEQRAIIDSLDTAHLKGGPVGTWRQPTPEEKAYAEFLNRAAVDTGHAKDVSKVTDSQRARTEEWLSQHAKQYPDEPIVQEWYAQTYRKPDDLPWWMQEPAPSPEAARFQMSVADEHEFHESLFDDAGEATPNAEDILQGKGAEEAAQLPGYADAVASLGRGEIPMDFINSVANSPLHIYTKTAIGRHLNSISGGALKSRDWSHAPAVKRMFPEVMSLAGLWEATRRGLYFSAEAHPVDWIHEFTHALETSGSLPKQAQDAIWRHVGAEPGAKLTHDQSEDMADIVTSTVLGFDPAKSTLPDDVKAALVHIRDTMKTKANGRNFTREKAMLDAFPEEERVFIEDIFRYQEEEAPYFSNGFHPRPGQYIPERAGLPFGGLNPLAPRRSASLWARALGKKKIRAVTQTDEHLRHAWKGALIASGRWEKSVVNGPLEGLMKAYQIEKMQLLHDRLVKIGYAQPTSEYGLRDWVMVPVNPKGWTEKTRAQARDVIDILKAFDTGDTVDAAQLSKVDAQAIEQVKDYMFPGLTDDSAAKIEDFVKEALVQPIDGVVWVPKPLMMRTGMFDSPIITGLAETPASRALLYGVDSMNNIMKMMTLSLNPAYYPMNIAGQNIMLLSQLGFTAPFSLARTLRQMRNMSEEDLALIDRFSGIGFMGAQALTEGGAAKALTNAVGHVSTILVDKYPRRASFFHEARRLGYKTEEQISRLVNDIDNFDDLMTVHERVQRAMVDYGNLNRFEKGIATHLIFVYPWLRGAGKYTMQFPFDHPIQAAAFAGLIYWQQNRLRESFPEGYPGFMKWYLPLTTPKTGQNPYGFRMDQLATPLQTLDIAAMMAYWGSGKRVSLPWGSNEEAMASMLGPLAEEIEKTVAGYDSFTQQQISHGIPDMFIRILDPRERWASWTRLQKILDHQTHTGLYDTTQTQNWLRLFLGSLAPVNVDVAKAADLSAGVGTKSPAQNRKDYIAKVEKVNGAPLTEEEKATISTWKAHDQAYNKVSRKFRDDHEIEGDTTIQEKVAILLLTVAEVNPAVADEAKRRADLALNVSDDEAQAAYDELRQALGLKQLGTLDGRMRKAQRAAREKVAS